MKAHLLEFIQSEIAVVEHGIKARQQGADTWRSGPAKDWRSVGCKLHKSERLENANQELRIMAKLQTKLSLYKEVLTELSK